MSIKHFFSKMILKWIWNKNVNWILNGGARQQNVPLTTPKHRNNDYLEFEGIIMLKHRVLLQFEEDKQHANEKIQI